MKWVWEIFLFVREKLGNSETYTVATMLNILKLLKNKESCYLVPLPIASYNPTKEALDC